MAWWDDVLKIQEPMANSLNEYLRPKFVEIGRKLAATPQPTDR